MTADGGLLAKLSEGAASVGCLCSFRLQPEDADGAVMCRISLRLGHGLWWIVAATERGRQELIEVLVRVPAEVRAGQRLLRDAIRLAVVGRSLFEMAPNSLSSASLPWR